MSEEKEGPESGKDGAGVDPFAAAIALSGASREEADAFLREQRALASDHRRMVHLQMKELEEESPLMLSHLRIRRFGDYAKMALEISIGLVMLALVAGISLMVWNAAHSEGYVIESFAVPPDLAARGMTGEVVAARLLDRLNVVQMPVSNSVATAQSLSISASEEVKVEIPQTGISLGELYRFLRRWLGHEIHVSGEVVRQDSNLAVAVRVNGRDGASYQGPEAELESLLQKAAEHVVEGVLPVRYATWLMTQTARKDAEARAVLQRVIADPAQTPLFRSAAWMILGNMSANEGNARQALTLYRRAQEADPTQALGFTNAVNNEIGLSHPEAALALLPKAQGVFEKNHVTWTPGAISTVRARNYAWDATLRGDYARAVAELQPATRSSFQPYNAMQLTALSGARMHDGAAAAWLAEQTPPASQGTFGRFANPLQIEAALQHWPRVFAMVAQDEKLLMDKSFSKIGRELISSILLRPWLALAKAKTGDIAGAERLIAATPSDCYDCVLIRGRIAHIAKQPGRADYWFAHAVEQAPSIPVAYQDWGRALLDRKQPDAAIELFKLSNKKGPHFADPLEGWGEALMVKNQSHLALAKFKEADKYAPNWGRLHLKWGEALVYAGKKDEAKVQFARAAQLDLNPSEKAAMAGMH